MYARSVDIIPGLDKMFTADWECKYLFQHQRGGAALLSEELDSCMQLIILVNCHFSTGKLVTCGSLDPLQE